MTTGTAWASDLAAIQKQLAAVLSSQERVAHAVAELKADIAPVLVSLPRRPSRPSCHASEARPGAAAECQDGLACGGPAHGAYMSESAKAADISEPSAAECQDEFSRDRSTETKDSRQSEAILCALDRHQRSDFFGDPDTRRPQSRKVERFRKLLSHNEQRSLLAGDPAQSLGSLSCDRLRLRRSQHFEAKLDAVFALVIVLNMLVIAMEMDADRAHGPSLEVWTALHIVFSALFWAEICCRLRLHGFRRHFRGKDRLMNALDAALVVTDTVHVISLISLGADAMRGVPTASLLRVLRIFRISRVIRVLKSPMFTDLLTIVNGLRGGLVTLGWSFVLFFLVLYAASLVCRETIGRGGAPHVGAYFDTVPRALLTMVRCGFGDFTSADGMPIIEQVVGAYGMAWGFFYGVFVFFVSVGVLNVIAAAFLESTLATTAKLQRAKLQMRLADKELWYSRACVLINGLLAYTGCELPDGAGLSENADIIMAAEVRRSDVARLAKTEAMSRALRDLDIDPRDDPILGDILDTQHTGYVTILDFVNGLQRLRGSDLRRSDVLSIDLMVRALQETASDVSRALRSLEGRGGGKADGVSQVLTAPVRGKAAEVGHTLRSPEARREGKAAEVSHALGSSEADELSHRLDSPGARGGGKADEVSYLLRSPETCGGGKADEVSHALCPLEEPKTGFSL